MGFSCFQFGKNDCRLLCGSLGVFFGTKKSIKIFRNSLLCIFRKLGFLKLERGAAQLRLHSIAITNCTIVFSRRFMKWNTTTRVTLFFNPHELAKIVLQNFYKILWCQIEPIGLANWIKTVFPRNIQHRARLKGPPFSFFLHWETFVSKKC